MIRFEARGKQCETRVKVVLAEWVSLSVGLKKFEAALPNKNFVRLTAVSVKPGDLTTWGLKFSTKGINAKKSYV